MPKYTFNFDGTIQIEAKNAEEADDKMNDLLGSLDLWDYNYDIDVESDEDEDEE